MSHSLYVYGPRSMPIDGLVVFSSKVVCAMIICDTRSVDVNYISCDQLHFPEIRDKYYLVDYVLRMYVLLCMIIII